MFSVFISIIIIAVAAILGRQVILWLQTVPEATSSRLLFSTATGLGTLLSLVWIAALFGWLYLWVVWLIFLIGLAVGWKQIYPVTTDLKKGLSSLIKTYRESPLFLKVLLGLLLVQECLLLLSCLAPIANGDSIASYLYVPRKWVEYHSFFHPPHAVLGATPVLILTMNSIGLLFKSPSLSMLLSGWWMAVLSSMAVYSVTRLFATRWVALISAAFFLFIPDVILLVESTKVDLGWVFFDLAGILAFLYISKHKKNRNYLFLSGVLIGFSLSSKFIGLYSAFIIFLFIPFFIKSDTKFSAKPFLIAWLLFVSGLLLTFWPTYTYNMMEYRNPVYPAFAQFFERVWGGHNPQDYAVVTGLNPETGLFGYFKIFWDMSLKPGFAFGMGSLAGPFILAFIPGILLYKKNIPREIKIVLLYILVYSILWYLGKQRTRHFLPALGILSGLAAWSFWQFYLHGRKYQKTLVSCCVVAILLFQTGLINANTIVWRIPTVVGLRSEEDYLRHIFRDGRAYPNYEMIQYINSNLPPNSRIVCLWNYSAFYIKPDFMTHEWIDGYHAADMTSEKELVDFLREHKVTHVLVNSYLLDRFKRRLKELGRVYPESLLEDEDFEEKYFEAVFHKGTQTLFELELLTVKE